MTSHWAFMMIGVIITQLQSALSEQLIYYQLVIVSFPAKEWDGVKNGMESTHWLVR